jgi:hypothetical protein
MSDSTIIILLTLALLIGGGLIVYLEYKIKNLEKENAILKAKLEIKQ